MADRERRHALADIEAELERLRAGVEGAGEEDSIGVNDEQDGWASLGASDRRRDLYWYGRDEEVLARLRKLPSGCGPDTVRREFRSRYPDLGGQGARQ
jgi:hypothetical protein